MLTTYQLKAAEDLNANIVDEIKEKYKNKAITITIEEDSDLELTDELKKMLDERLNDDESEYVTREDLMERLSDKYGL